MDILEEIAGEAPEKMRGCIIEAFNSIFGEPILEGQREIDAMTRDNAYKALAASMMGHIPNDWNEPYARRKFEEMHAAFNMRADEMYNQARQRARGMGMELAEQKENAFANKKGTILTVLQITLNQIRGAILNFDGACAKYMPGITRISLLSPQLGGCGMQTPMQDAGRLKLLKAFTMYASEVCPDPEAPGAEFDVNYNGMTLDDIMQQFGNAVRDIIETGRAEVNNYQPNHAEESGNYRIVKINSFAEARQYRRYAPWCICDGEMYWNTYSLGGANTVYFCLRDGFENEPEVAGEDAPLDRYGLSMFCIIVDSDGDLANSTTRWNDQNGGTDWSIKPSLASDLVNMPFNEAFPADPHDEAAALRAQMGRIPNAGRQF